MASLSSIKKDSIATTQDSFKGCILACTIRNQMLTKFKKIKVTTISYWKFAQKWVFCETYVLCNNCFIVSGQNSFKEMFKVTLYLL